MHSLKITAAPGLVYLAVLPDSETDDRGQACKKTPGGVIIPGYVYRHIDRDRAYRRIFNIATDEVWEPSSLVEALKDTREGYQESAPMAADDDCIEVQVIGLPPNPGPECPGFGDLGLIAKEGHVVWHGFWRAVTADAGTDMAAVCNADKSRVLGIPRGSTVYIAKISDVIALTATFEEILHSRQGASNADGERAAGR